MTPFSATIRPKARRLGDSECDAIVAAFAVNAETGPATNEVWLIGQFLAHLVVDSVVDAEKKPVLIKGIPRNRYDFDAHGRNGLYSPRGAGAMTMKDGKFRHTEDSLWRVEHEGQVFEIAGDPHRVNENRPLGAMHLLFEKLHNRLIDEGHGFAAAQAITVACFSHAVEAAFMPFCRMDKAEFRSIRHRTMFREVGWHFQAGRLHQLVPDTIGGKDIFDKSMFSGDVDLAAIIAEPCGAFGMRLSESMNSRSMGGDTASGSILDLTISHRHNGVTCPTWGDMARAAGRTADPETREWPAFAGMAHEAQDGLPGPVGARIIADGISGALAWGQATREGLWLNMGNYPKTLTDIIDFTKGKKRGRKAKP